MNAFFSHILKFRAPIKECINVTIIKDILHHVEFFQRLCFEKETFLLSWARKRQPRSENRILPRVYGSVTNNIGFWIRWLDLLMPSFTIALNHIQWHIQQLTITDYLQLAPVWLDYDCLLFYCDWLRSDLRVNYEWRMNYESILMYEWMRSYLNGRLYSLAVSMEVSVECSLTRKRLLYRVGL
jgi:hypothetical protein